MKLVRILLACVLCAGFDWAAAQTPTTAPSASAVRWTNGPPVDENYFPIAVWLQDPRNAARYKAAGINLYVGLWRGPTTNQLRQLEAAGMPVICSQNRLAREQFNRRIIVGWMHGDEPDNAQSLGQGKGYGPPILPEKIIRDYESIRAADPSRPVLLNLGQGVAWDNYIGRGVRRRHPEDYTEYVQGADIVSFDIYPVVHDSPEIVGKLEFVAHGVERLVRWTAGAKAVWNCIECTHIGNARLKPTPGQVRTEVWMALIHGSRGLIYFVHQFKPTFQEAALLEDPEMLEGVTAINRQIRELAPVLNSPTVAGGASVPSADGALPIAWMLKRRADASWLFAVNMTNQPARGSFTLKGLPEDADAKVLGESRSVSVRRGEWTDAFEPYAVHLYHFPAPRRKAETTPQNHSPIAPLNSPLNRPSGTLSSSEGERAGERGPSNLQSLSRAPSSGESARKAGEAPRFLGSDGRMKLRSREVFLRHEGRRPPAAGFVSYVSKNEPLLMHCHGWEDYSDGYDDYSLVLDVYDARAQAWSERRELAFPGQRTPAMSFSFPLKTSTGRLIFPGMRKTVDDSGKAVHFKKGWATVDEAVGVIGEYAEEGRIDWHLGTPLRLAPEVSSRGLNENALAELPDGRLVAICRGDNSAFPEKPGYKWLSFSRDRGETWSAPVPLPATGGDPLESGSNGSALFRSIHNGRLYWMGNLALHGERAHGNWPRSPLVIVEVQEEPFALKRETLFTVDERAPDEPAKTQHSNFRFYQDRETGDVVIFLTRYGERSEKEWMLADYYRYRVQMP